MGSKMTRAERRHKIHRRIRPHVLGSSKRPRLCVFRTARHTYAQLIDDEVGKTLSSASTLKVDGKKMPNGGNVEAAKSVGTAIAASAKDLGVAEVVFDRNGFIYHGRVKAVAEAAREAGLKF